MMKHLGSGLCKGLVIGIVIGFLFDWLDTGQHLFGTKVLLYGVTGACTGFLCGSPIWTENSRVSSFIKAAVGAGLGCVLMIAFYYVCDFELGNRRVTSNYPLVSSLFAMMYGAFVEFDEKTGP